MRFILVHTRVSCYSLLPFIMFRIEPEHYLFSTISFSSKSRFRLNIHKKEADHRGKLLPYHEKRSCHKQKFHRIHKPIICEFQFSFFNCLRPLYSFCEITNDKFMHFVAFLFLTLAFLQIRGCFSVPGHARQNPMDRRKWADRRAATLTAYSAHLHMALFANYS